jgi:class 3 adenylate cyclase/tetratricopeptide (TPR) repeat protein
VTIGAHRKVVTVLFCDVVGSTELGESVDPEALQGVLARYFERMKRIVESHGGSVEKFIGDAVMAVFGVPVAHEDDALRACRVAVEMREALPELGVEGRIGVNTGEVLTGTQERLATGDAVNVAARLEQAALPGEVLIGAETLALVEAAVEVGDEQFLELKGKREPVAAYPLVSIREAAERSHVSRFVGRERELQQLVDAWDRALAGPHCELVTIVGDPGVGKSRLVAEALARIDGRVVRGRCLSYGEGITYFPVVEVVKQLAALPSDGEAAKAIRSLLGESDAVSGTDEIGWAFRKLLEEQAPLVVCFDDIQWGEETFLDLVESIALLSAGAPILLVCMARQELLDRRPGWPAVLRLEPLPEEEAGRLVGDAVPDELRQQIVRASGGNPLFLTEMAALGDADGEEVEVPPTLRALLAARLDQLDERERRVLERGAVEGELFHRGTVQALAPEETEVTPRLAALVRRDLVRPDQPVIPREDAYRFRHLLIRDAAYEALPKAARAELHQRFADWLEGHGRDLVELDEILGYHLEQAVRYRVELGQPESELALAAGERLRAAGRRALSRNDNHAAAGLFERALILTRPLRLDVHLEVDLANATWPDVQKAQLIAQAAAERAQAEDDETAELLARIAATTYALAAGGGSPDELERLALSALPLLETAGDHRGLAQVWYALGYGVANMRCSFEEWAFASEQAIRHARLDAPSNPFHFGLPQALTAGPRPAAEALETLDSLLPERTDPLTTGRRAVLLAMLDQIAIAQELAAAADERERELGTHAGQAALHLSEVAEIAGDEQAAAEHLRRLCAYLEETGQRGALSSFAPRLGRALCALGRYEEAETLAEQGRELGDHQDALTQELWRQVKALVHAHMGEHEKAEVLAREAIAIADTTDALGHQGDARADLADVLLAAGRRDEAAAALAEALDRYERKQIIPLALRIRERLDALQDTPR